jgi:hypothetical protein
MDVVVPPLNTEDCQENRSANNLSDNSAQEHSADERWNNGDSRGDQRWANVAP